MSSNRNAHAGPSTHVARRIEDVAQEEKGEDELELEEALFGRKRRRATTAKVVAEVEGDDDEAPAFFYDGMGDGRDEDVDVDEDADEGPEKQASRLPYFASVANAFAALLYGQLGARPRTRRRLVLGIRK